MVKNFENQWALILGGSSGLGLASAKKLANHGMNLIIVHRDRRSDMKVIQEDFNYMRNKGVQVESFNVDAINATKRQTVIQEIKEILVDNKLSVLLHSIAKGNLKAISRDDSGLNSEDFMLTIESMGISLYSWVVECLQRSLFKPDSRVISFTSEGSSKVQQHYAAVSAAKATLESLTRSLALELSEYEIKCNCIQAGTTITKSFKMIPGSDKIASYSKQRNPYNRLTLPEEVANAVYLLCLPEASWINGTVLLVDGGEHLR